MEEALHPTLPYALHLRQRCSPRVHSWAEDGVACMVCGVVPVLAGPGP